MVDGKSEISTLLFRERPSFNHPGRRVHFDASQPDIRFVTGPIGERVFGYLNHTSESVTAKDIAIAIDSNTSRVTQALKKLVRDNLVSEIVLEGYRKEYGLLAGTKDMRVQR